MTKTSLYADMQYLQNSIDTMLVQCPEMIEDAVLRADMLAGSTTIEEVISRILVAIRKVDIQIGGIKPIIDDLMTRKARFERQKETLRGFVQSLMDRGGLNKMSLPEATLSISWHKPTAIIVDEEALPEECVRYERRPDKISIKKWCEAGNIPDGVRLSNGSSHLSIRTK